MKENLAVNSVAVVTTRFISGMCYCTVHSDVGTGDFSGVLGIWHMCTYGFHHASIISFQGGHQGEAQQSENQAA